MNIIEDQYRHRIHEAENKILNIGNIPSSQWQTVNNNEQAADFDIYVHVINDITTYKLVKELNTSEVDLDHFKACFTNFSIRSQWHPGIKDIKTLHKLNQDISVLQVTTTSDDSTICVEQVIKKKSSVQYITTDQTYLMTCIIENKQNYARATLFCQWEKVASVTYIPLSSLLDKLISVEPFPYISQCHESISIQHIQHQGSNLDVEYLYQFKEDSNMLPAPAVDIHHKVNRSPRWHSGSWEQQYDRSGISGNSQTLRKNKFMSSSLLFASSSTNSSPQLNPSASYKMVPWTNEEDEEYHILQSKDKLTIHTPYIPDLTISLPDKNDQFMESFSRLCIHCYQNKHIYIIQIVHPQNFIQYLNQEPSETLDDEEDKPIKVKLHITSSHDNLFRVNQNGGQIKPWQQNEDDEDEEDELPTTEEDIHVFQDDIIPAPSNYPTEKLQPTMPEPTMKTETKQVDDTNPSNQSSEGLFLDDDKTLETDIPEHDPVALQTVYPKFKEYLQPSLFTIIQSPTKDNGYVTVKKFDIPDHPLGGFLGETTWNECSIWDIKAVLENAGARKIWDNTFENSTFLHTLTSSSSLWHTKMKGAWPVSPRDYVYFHGQYTTSTFRVDLLSTSCFGDSYQYKALPNKEISGYIRATADVMGWRLERLDEKTVSVKQVIVTQFPTWVVNFITSRFITQTCASVSTAQSFLAMYGAPPSLESLLCAQLVNIKYDHERKNWRCEYTRRMDTQGAPTTSSIIRLDKRRWAAQNQYAVVIDPPPSRVSATERACDPYGVWLTVEHDEAFIIPLRGKILVLIKPEETTTVILGTTECQLNINGVRTPIDKEAPPPQRPNGASFSKNFLKAEREEEEASANQKTPQELPNSPPAAPLTDEEKAIQAVKELPITPKDHARATLTFLKQTDEQFGWTVISDNAKQGLRISKKHGVKPSNDKTNENSAPEMDTKHALKVYEPYMVYKGSKVIENFSLEEVTAVVTDINHVRKTYDDTIEQQTDLVLEADEPGLRIIRQTVKAIFPFKNREFYAVSCLAQEESSSSTSSSTTRVFYSESSLPDFPIINKTKARGQLLVSGWILEPIDPYNTTTANHPIPSTRVTYVASLDLGSSVPSYMSNLVANNWFPKKIQAVENYLKTKGPPPYISNPCSVLSFTNNQINNEVSTDYRWTRIHSSYDAKSQLKIITHLITKEGEGKKKPLVPSPQQQQTDDVVPSPSTSATLVPPFRRPSNHTISSGAENRRGSLPTNAISKKRSVQLVTPTMTSSSTSNNTTTAPSTNVVTPNAASHKTMTFLQTTFDLRVYPKGYEIQAQLYSITEKQQKKKRKDMTQHLVLSIMEPPLSHLIDKKSHKHNVAVKAPVAMGSEYEFEFTVIPARDEVLNKKATRLTVSHVLGEDEVNDMFILVNGVEVHVNEDIQVKSLVENEEIEDMETEVENTGVEVEPEGITGSEESQYGVVATALGNVSAGVNNIGARMMIPFRAASNSFLLSNNENSANIEPVPISENEIASSDDEHGDITEEEKNRIDTSTTIHEVRVLRRRSDTMRKGMLLLLICVGLAVVFALLMLQPLLERYNSAFPPTDSTIDSTATIRRLIQIPWFGGWDIQLIAVRRRV